MYAIPAAVMDSPRSYGLPWEFQDFDEFVVASQLRVVQKMSGFWCCITMTDESVNHDNSESLHPLTFWFVRTCTRMLKTNHDRWSCAEGLPIALAQIKFNGLSLPS